MTYAPDRKFTLKPEPYWHELYFGFDTVEEEIDVECGGSAYGPDYNSYDKEYVDNVYLINPHNHKAVKPSERIMDDIEEQVIPELQKWLDNYRR